VRGTKISFSRIPLVANFILERRLPC